MINQIYPCLWFDGQAKAAAEFYCSIFKNSRITIDTPMVVNFELSARPDDPSGRGIKLMGLNGGPEFKLNQSISFFVACKSKTEADEIWNKLFEGGKALMPIDKYPWSERYGWVEDKFGLSWQVSLTGSDDTKQMLTPSFLFTGKQFGHGDEAIKVYTSIFENSSVTTIKYYPEKEHGPGKVLYSEFKLNGRDFIIMDGPGNHAFSFNEALSMVVECDTQKEIDYCWNSLLANGGAESMCGWLKDKFGVWWQIIPANIGKLMSDPEKGQRVMQAIFKMRKLDIKMLQDAYDK